MDEQVLNNVRGLLVEIITSLPAVANIEEQLENAPPFIKLILKGRNPADMLVQQISTLEEAQLQKVIEGAKRIVEAVG